MKKYIVAAFVAVGLLVGGIAYAAIPGAGGTINACYTDALGGTARYIRLIDVEAGQVCRADEVGIEWNQEGPQGEQGPAGPAGQDGVSGYEINYENFSFNGQGASDQRAVFCSTGKKVVGGGFRHVSGAAPNDIVVITSGPVAGWPSGDTFGAPVSDRWAVRIQNNSQQALVATIFAICVTA